MAVARRVDLPECFNVTYYYDQRHGNGHRHKPDVTGSDSATGCGVSHTARTTTRHTAPEDEPKER